MLGHELRNPLGAIANATRLLDHPRTSAEMAAQARQIIGRQVEHLARMTDDLLDAGRAITGKIALRRQPVDLAAAAADTLGTLEPRTERHRVVLEAEPCWVDADPTRLEQIIANLVVNAVKYTPEGGAIRVGVRRESGAAVLRVADEGIGMPPELVARAFDLFVQGDRGLDRSHGGLGIGLTLVRRLAELHGGSVEAKSDGPGKGSQFVVTLPLAAEEIATSAPGNASAGKEPINAARRVLVVDDNRDAADSLSMLLAARGHEVRVAYDGLEAVGSAIAFQPDVVLMDIGLPKLYGYDAARRIRDARGKDVLLVAITGWGQDEDRRRSREAGFDFHLTKPVDPEAIVRLIDDAWIQRR